MGREIPTDSRAIIEKIIRRHPRILEEYCEKRESVLEGSSPSDGMPRSNCTDSRLEKTVIKLNSKKMLRMEEEIRAVKSVYEILPEQYKTVIRYRFWQNPISNTPYYLISKQVKMSETQCKRVVARFIQKVGRELGEL